MIKKFRNILFFADGAKGEVAALRRAFGLASHNDAELSVIGVVGEFSTNDPQLRHNINQLQKTMIRDRGLELDKLIANISPASGKKASVRKQVVVGKDYVEVIRAVQAGKHDLLVKSVNAPTLWGGIFGSTDTRLLHLCPCPVMILKPLRRKTWNTILVAVDPRADTPEAEALNDSLMELGASIANIESSDLHFLHVLQRPHENMKTRSAELKALDQSLHADAERNLDEMMEGYSSYPARKHLAKGLPHAAISKFVGKHEVDLLVMGSVARSGIPGLIVGNTAEKILAHVDCSVLVIKPKGWKTPVA